MTYTPPTPPSDGANGYPGATPPPYGQPNGSPYGAPTGGSPYGAPAGPQGGAPEVKNFLAFSIISTVLFWPVGLFAIIKSTQVKSNLTVGNYQGAVESSKSAKTLALIATIIGGISWLISIAIIVFSIVIAGLAVNTTVESIKDIYSSNSSSLTEDTQAQLSATSTGTGTATVTIIGGPDGFKSTEETFTGTFSTSVTVPAGGTVQLWVYPDGTDEGSCEIIIDGTSVSQESGFLPLCASE